MEPSDKLLPHLTDNKLMIRHLGSEFYPEVMNSIPDNVANCLGEMQVWWFSITNMGHYGNPQKKNQHKAEICWSQLSEIL